VAKKMNRFWLVVAILITVIVATVYLVVQWAWATPAPVYVSESAPSQNATVEITYIAN
jgi:hypothetical protein